MALRKEEKDGASLDDLIDEMKVMSVKDDKQTDQGVEGLPIECNENWHKAWQTFSRKAKPKKLESNTYPTYIIVAHGAYAEEGYIKQKQQFFEGINFSRLVSKGAILQGSQQTRDDSAIEHIDGILEGTINVFSLLPKKEREELLKIPNLYFAEGKEGERGDNFKATIVRHYKGDTTFYNLTTFTTHPKLPLPTLIKLEREWYDNDIMLKGENREKALAGPYNKEQTNMVSLNELIPILRSDAESATGSNESASNRFDIVFATCLEKLDETNLNNLVLQGQIIAGQDKTKTHIIPQGPRAGDITNQGAAGGVAGAGGILGLAAAYGAAAGAAGGPRRFGGSKRKPKRKTRKSKRKSKRKTTKQKRNNKAKKKQQSKKETRKGKKKTKN
tara:strand:- start:10890 stop:12053 length:1164 start_codon:yes stop_codon:yes gene_type:complete